MRVLSEAGPGEFEPELEELEQMETDLRYFTGLAVDETRESVASHLIFAATLEDNGDVALQRYLDEAANAVRELSAVVEQFGKFNETLRRKLLAARSAHPEKDYLGSRYTEPLSFSRRAERLALCARRDVPAPN